MRSRYITDKEIQTIKKDVNPDIAIIMDIGIQTGLRINDICTLERKHLWYDFVNDKYYIRRKAQKTGKEGRWEITKGVYNKLWRRNGYLFEGRDPGTHINRSTVWRAIKRACEAESMDTYGKSPHSLRKIYAVKTRLRDGIEAAQDGLQHDNRSLTRLYAYADKLVKADRDEPIRWIDLELICEYILDRTFELLDKKRKILYNTDNPKNGKSNEKFKKGNCPKQVDKLT